MTPSKETNKAPKTDPKEMERCELSDKFRIILVRKFNVLQGNTNRQLNKIMKTMHGQNEKSENELTIMKKAKQKS